MAGSRKGSNVGDGQLAFDELWGAPADPHDEAVGDPVAEHTEPSTQPPSREGEHGESVWTPGPAALEDMAAQPAEPDPEPGGVLFQLGPGGRATGRRAGGEPGRGRPRRGGLPDQAGEATHGQSDGGEPDSARDSAATTGAGTPAGRGRRHPDLAGDHRLAADGTDPRSPGLPRAGRRTGAAEGEHPAGQQPVPQPPHPAPLTDPGAGIPAPAFRPGSQHDLAPAGAAAKVEANLAAVRLLRRLQAEDRPATAAEQTVLARWSGWGAVPNVFDDADRHFAGARAELRSLLDDNTWRAAAKTTLNAHYTDATYAAAMWNLIGNAGLPVGARVLE